MKRTPAELARFVSAAEAGDGESARQVWIHYLTVGDRAKYRVWLRRAAELEDCDSIAHWAEAIEIIRYDDFPAEELEDVRTLAQRASCGSLR